MTKQTDQPKGEPEVGSPQESILEEAQRLIHGDRGASYGPPSEDFAKTAKMISGLLLPKLKPGMEVSAREAILIIVLVKASRGIGLERVHAPRVRFFCRPEIVVIDLVPTTP